MCFQNELADFILREFLDTEVIVEDMGEGSVFSDDSP